MRSFYFQSLFPLAPRARLMVLFFAFALSLLAVISAHAAGEPTGSMAQLRSGHAVATLMDGRLLVTGGNTAGSVEIYDPATGNFISAAPLTQARSVHAAVALSDGRVLVMGGRVSGTGVASAELYDPSSGAWSAIGPMNVVRHSPRALRLADGRVLVIAGDQTGATSEVFDPVSGTFTPSGSLLTPRSSFAAAALQDGRVLVVGGWQVAPEGGPVLATAEIWDPTSGAWTAAGLMGTPRLGATATTLADGRVLIAGGSISGSFLNAAAVAELYDPLLGTFSATGALSVPRTYHQAELMGDGNLVVSGGYSALTGTTEGSLERFDTATGTWRYVGLLAERRTGHTATLLTSGNVLVAGGYNGSSALASAEIVNPVCVSVPPTISPGSASFTFVGGSGSVEVTHLPGCHWRASTLSSWITITSPSEGTGNGTVTYDVAEHTSSYGRGTTPLIADNAFSISQSSNPCASASITPTGQSFPTGGGSASVTLTTNSACNWTVTGAPPWMTITSGGTGSATIAYTVAANTGEYRSATIVIAGRSLTVTQSASPCSPAPMVLPASQSFGSSGGSAFADVTAPSTCNWTVSGNPSWITTSVSGGTGPRSITVTAATNTGAERSAIFTIANNSYTVTQAAACNATTSLSPTSQSFAAAGGSGSVSVTQVGSCPWSVTNVPSWITITSGSPGTGSGIVGYTVAANTGASRSALLWIAGRSHSVSQAAATTGGSCGYVASVESVGTYSGSLATTDCTGGARGPSYYTDRYSFTASPGQQVAFYLSSSAFDTYLYLKNPSGTVIASNDDGGGGTNSRIPTTSGVFTLPAGTSGTYVVEVTSYSARATGAYTLQRLQ